MIIETTAVNLLQEYDFAEFDGMLKAIYNGEKKIAAVAEVLENVTGLDWTPVGTAPYSTEGAVIRYYGDNSEFLPTCSLYEKVLILELSDSCTAVSGKVYLQINRAETTNEDV